MRLIRERAVLRKAESDSDANLILKNILEVL